MVFSGIKGTLYPAVCFYSGLRTVSILKVQRLSGNHSGGASAAVSAHAKALVREVQKKKEEVRWLSRGCVACAGT